MFGRSFIPAVSLVLAIVAAPSSHAQSSVAFEGGVRSVGDGSESISLFEAGVRFGSLRPKQVNSDIRISTFPQGLTGGVIVLSTDFDAAVVLPLGKGAVATPRAGLSLVGAASGEGAGGAPGLNVGLGVIAGLTSPVGVRFDYSYSTYFAIAEGIRASSFSIGIVWVH